MTKLRTASLGRALCLAGASLGAIGLIGWFTGTGSLVTIVPGQPPMMPNTALGVLLLGLAGTLLHASPRGRATRLLSLLAAIVVLIIALGTIAEYLLELPFSIDQLLVRSEAEPFPGRPSPPTAVALACLAAAILLLDVNAERLARPSEWLILCTGLVALTFAVAQLFGSGPLYQFSDIAVVGVAVPTALSLLLVSVGLLFKQPGSSVMRIATSPSPGGVMLRRLAPALILIGLSIGFTASRLHDIIGSENAAVVFASLTVFGIAVVLPLFVITATRLNRAHDALEKSRQAARDLIDQASDGVFIADLEGHYIDVNDAGCRMLGYSREELLGKTILDLIRPEDEARLRSDRARFLEGGSAVGEWLLLMKDGTYLPVEVSAKILPDRRWQAMVRDISGRKRTEEALRQTQERFEFALKGADLALWDWNVITGEVTFNPRWAEMRGFRPEEIKPHVDSSFDGIHPDDRQAVQKALNDCLEGVRPEFDCEYRAATKSGEWVWVLDRGKVFGRDEQGRALRMVGTELDITARKRAIQMRDEILGIVAHDLRNPLAAISALGAVLSMQDTEREIGEEIGSAVNRMNRLIQDLLDVTSIEAGHLSLRLARLAAAEVASDSVPPQTLLAASASLELRLDVAPDLPDIWADRDRLRQVFENLIGNAIKFTKPHGQITLGATAHADEVLFSVADTGSGIASSHLPHVFDRFWQARNDKRQGAGLGLAIVKGVVEAHGGRIWVQSTPGQGSTFFFTIPTAASQAAAAHGAAA